eukprot:COSAG02_NODE_37512_length_441_cov_0.669591_1_plen_47_part_00
MESGGNPFLPDIDRSLGVIRLESREIAEKYQEPAAGLGVRVLRARK